MWCISLIDKKEYIDAESALSRIGKNVALYKKLLKHYLDDSHIEALCSAIENNEPEEIGRISHTIKGVSANLSLTKLRTISTNIETNAKSGLDCTAFIPELRQAFDATEKLILEYLD